MPTTPVGSPPIMVPDDFADAESSYVNMLRFYGNNFTGTGEMLPPFQGQSPLPGARPFAGIYLCDLSSFRIPAVIGAGAFYNNIFDGLANGFVSERVAFRIDQAMFMNIVEDPNSNYSIEGYGVHTTDQILGRITGLGGTETSAVSFDNCKVAIYSESGSMVIKDTHIENTDFGVQIKRAITRRTHILDNYISTSEGGIQVNHGIPLNSGIISNNIIRTSGDPDKAVGIAVSDLPVEAHWEITNNVLTLGEAKHAIHIIQGSEALVRNNSIGLLPAQEEDRWGIFVEGAKDIELGCNLIFGDAQVMSTKFSWGMFLSAAHGALITCNDVSTCRYGISAAGIADGTFMRGNIFGPNWVGLQLGRPPDDGNVAIGDQVHEGNIWSGQFGDFGAVHYGNQLIIDMSKFFVDPTTNSEYQPPSIDANGTWFRTSNDNDNSFICSIAQECPNGIGYQGLAPVWTELDTVISVKDLGFKQYDKSLSWTGRLHTYRRLKAWENQLTLPQVLDDFLNNNATTNIGTFSNVYDSLTTAYIPSTQRSNDMGSWLDGMESDFLSLLEYDSLFYNDPTNAGYLSGTITDLNSLYDVTEEYSDTLNQLNTTALVTISNARQILNTISSNDSWQSNLRDALKEVVYYFDRSQTPNMNFLTNLAASCPDAEGDAVFIARARLAELGQGATYDDYNLCAQVGHGYGAVRPKSGEKGISTADLVVWPNPAGDIFSVKTKIPMSYVRLINLSGSLVRGREATGHEISFRIGDLSTGMYVVEVTLQDGSRITESIILNGNK